jgi:hypothetical protein
MEFDHPVPPMAEPPTNQRPFEGAPSHAAGLGGEEPTRRFYAVATMIAVPVFFVIFAMIARFALPDPAGRPVGIGAAVLALLFAVLFVRIPYVAIVSPDGSLTFKALTRTQETSVSRISRIGLSTGARGASSWIFQFDGSTARLGDIGGRALALYLVNLDPTIDAPSRIRRIADDNLRIGPWDSGIASAPQGVTVKQSERKPFVAPLAIILGLSAAVVIFFVVGHSLPRGPNVRLTTTQCTITSGGGQGYWTGTLDPLGPISQNSEVVVSWQRAGVTLWYGEVNVSAPIPENQTTPLAVHVYAQTPTPGSGAPSCSPVFKYDESPGLSGNK